MPNRILANLLEAALENVWNNTHSPASRASFSRQPHADALRTLCGLCRLFTYESRVRVDDGLGRRLEIVGVSGRGHVAPALYQDPVRTAVAGQPPHCATVSSHSSPRSSSTFSRARGVGYRVSIRAVDLVVSVLVLTVFAPLMLLIALLIKMDSPGPVLFR